MIATPHNRLVRVLGLAGVLVLALFALDGWRAGGTARLGAAPWTWQAPVQIPQPVEPAFVPPGPRALRAPETLAHWAPVARPVHARSAPSGAAPAVGRLSRRTPEGTSNLVATLARERDPKGRLWVEVRLPVLPNNTTGWVPRRALGGYGTVDTRLVVNLGRLSATLYRRGRPIFSAPVGIGRTASPTPTGHFYIRNKLTRYASPAYGPLAFGTSARSPVLTDWPAGGFVGIHGTDRPDLIPGRVSHGCIRMTNADIRKLGRLLPVGTPLVVR